jgi:hypothetical protein
MGYTLSWGRMWWGMPAFDHERRTRKGAFYRDVAAAGLFQGILFAKQGIDFDFTTDHEGLDRLGYDRILRVREDASVDVWPSHSKTNPPRLAVTGRWGPRREAAVPADATRVFRAVCLYGRPPEIDGNLSDWPQMEALSLEPSVEGAGNWAGPADLSANLFFGYGEDDIFIGATVRDDVSCQRHTGWSLWNGDCLQIGFDPLGSRDRDGYGPNMHEMGLTLFGERPACWRWHGRRGQAREEVPTVRLAIRRDENEGTTTYEAAIPFAELAPLCPEVLPTTGIAVTLHDADGEDRESYAETAPGALTAGKYPNLFDTLRFDAPPAGGERFGAWSALLWGDTVMPEGGTIDVEILSVFRNSPDGFIEIEVEPAGPTLGVPAKSRLVLPASEAPQARLLEIRPDVPAGEYRLVIRGLSSAGKTLMEESSPLFVCPRSTR